jgi:hypothetical protein
MPQRGKRHNTHEGVQSTTMLNMFSIHIFLKTEGNEGKSSSSWVNTVVPIFRVSYTVRQNLTHLLKGRPVISSPLAATSVQIRNLASWFLNLSRLALRSGGLRSP